MSLKTKLLLGLMATILVVITSGNNSFGNASINPKAPAITVAQRHRNIANEQQQIIKAILQDNQPISPQAPVKVKRIAIVEPYAVAIVLVGEEGGGMSALMKKQGVWRVIGGGGGAFDDKYLAEIGVPPETARKLMQQIEE
jgi:hypothetical protein